jgi:hypothetical protein
MSMVNKEPYITPEMIAAWNAGGGGTPQLIDSVKFEKADFSQNGNYYRCNKTLSATVAAQIRGAKAVNFFFYSVLGNYGTLEDERTILYDEIVGLKTGTGAYPSFHLLKGGGGDKCDIQVALKDSNSNITLNFYIVDTTIYSNMSASDKFWVNIYSLPFWG